MSERSDKAVQGAASGAAIGTAILPGWGTAAGAVAGGAYGWFTGKGKGGRGSQYGTGGTVGDYQVPGYGRLQDGYGSAIGGMEQQGDYYGGRDAYVSDQRGNQLGLGRTLAQEARGNGVGQRLVGMQARQAANRASAQQFAALGGARPGMQAMAARNAMLGSAIAQGNVGEQAAMGSAQMTLGAQGLYNQHLQGVRGQDETNQMNQRQLNDQSQLNAYGQAQGLMSQRLNLAGMQQQGNQSYQSNQTQRYGASLGVPTSGEKTMGALTGLGGGLMAYGAGRGGQGGQGGDYQPLQTNGGSYQAPNSNQWWTDPSQNGGVSLPGRGKPA